MPKINGNEIRPGNVLEHNGGLWSAVKVDHVKPGKGGAFAQVEMRNLRNGSKLNERFRSADKVERVRLEQKDQQFLYEENGMLNFMDAETYERIKKHTLATVRVIWLTQAGAVIIGHVLAILVAHALALRLHGDHRRAMLSQLPLALFMVAYTLFGLWLLASPRGV